MVRLACIAHAASDGPLPRPACPSAGADGGGPPQGTGVRPFAQRRDGRRALVLRRVGALTLRNSDAELRDVVRAAGRRAGREPRDCRACADRRGLRSRGNEALRFFFQAEDGIRDGRVTGVQTCALPISTGVPKAPLNCGNSGIEVNVWESWFVCSYSACQKTLFLMNGPPARPPNCWRSKGG